jgi:hypothetical protein
MGFIAMFGVGVGRFGAVDNGVGPRGRKRTEIVSNTVLQRFIGFRLHGLDRHRPASLLFPCSSLSGLYEHFSDSRQEVRD